MRTNRFLYRDPLFCVIAVEWASARPAVEAERSCNQVFKDRRRPRSSRRRLRGGSVSGATSTGGESRVPLSRSLLVRVRGGGLYSPSARPSIFFTTMFRARVAFSSNACFLGLCASSSRAAQRDRRLRARRRGPRRSDLSCDTPSDAW